MNACEEALSERVKCYLIYDASSSGKVKLNEQLECLPNYSFSLSVAISLSIFQRPKVWADFIPRMQMLQQQISA